MLDKFPGKLLQTPSSTSLAKGKRGKRKERKDEEKYIKNLKKMGKDSKPKGSVWPQLLLLVAIFIPFSMIYMPGVAIYYFVIADMVTPWVLFESPLFERYHQYVVKDLLEMNELPVPELHANNFTREDVIRITKGFTWPVVIRGVLENSTGVEKWDDADWWIKNYGNEEILCGTFAAVRDDCTIASFFEEVKNKNAFYVSGASKIFNKHADLRDMVEDPRLKNLETSDRKATQIFMGLKGMGSDIHSAIGLNIFRQMVGSKKWWFIPPSQTAYLKPSLNVNGISSHTHTMVGKKGEFESPWMKKIERYTTVMNAGDVLLNPPWFWHGILNLGEEDNSLVVGVPTRYSGKDAIIAAFKSNPVFTAAGLSIVAKNFIMNGFKLQDMEDTIKQNRQAREPGK